MRAVSKVAWPVVVCLGCLLCSPANAQDRPPAVPLVTHDPYLSIWSMANRLTDSETMHWTGEDQPLAGLIRIDNTTYRYMGTDPRPVPMYR
jgi:hypothetical protein